jgi:hypothetical protein
VRKQFCYQRRSPVQWGRSYITPPISCCHPRFSTGCQRPTNDLDEALDLQQILSTYEVERGYPEYHPTLMTKLIVYGYVRGVHSVRICSMRVWRTSLQEYVQVSAGRWDLGTRSSA